MVLSETTKSQIVQKQQIGLSVIQTRIQNIRSDYSKLQMTSNKKEQDKIKEKIAWEKAVLYRQLLRTKH